MSGRTKHADSRPIRPTVREGKSQVAMDPPRFVLPEGPGAGARRFLERALSAADERVVLGAHSLSGSVGLAGAHHRPAGDGVHPVLQGPGLVCGAPAEVRPCPHLLRPDLPWVDGGP